MEEEGERKERKKRKRKEVKKPTHSIVELIDLLRELLPSRLQPLTPDAPGRVKVRHHEVVVLELSLELFLGVYWAGVDAVLVEGLESAVDADAFCVVVVEDVFLGGVAAGEDYGSRVGGYVVLFDVGVDVDLVPAGVERERERERERESSSR